MNVFDIIGPVMIGPSSSHTAGAARIGRIARQLLQDEPVAARIELYGSFAKTYKGHGTDKALIAGILGMAPDDPRLRFSPRLAREQGLEITLTTGDLPEAHPNTAVLTLTGRSGGTLTVRGSSIGGGNIVIDAINGMPVHISGQHPSLIVQHRDRPGVIAEVTDLLADRGVNICNFSLSRRQKGGVAVMTIEMDGGLDEALACRVRRLPDVMLCVTLLPQ